MTTNNAGQDQRKRAAVVLFVDSDSGVDEHDLAFMVKVALRQAGAMEDGLTANFMNSSHHVRVVDVVEASAAMGAGYLKAAVTSKAWRNNGIEDARAS